MATKKTQTLEERLAERKIVNFDRGLIGSLDESTIRELVEDYIKHPTQSVGRRFIAAMESVYRKPVIAEENDVVNADVTVKEIIAVIGGESQSTDGTSITVGRRSDKRTFYLRWSNQLKAGDEVRIRDPFTKSGLLEKYVEAGETKYIGSEPYDAQVADGDGQLVIEQDLYVLLILSWSTSEASPVALTEVNRHLLESETSGKEVKAGEVAGYFPRAHDQLVRIKGEKRGRDWTRFVDSLMDTEAPSGSMPPFGSTTGGNLTPIDWPSQLDHQYVVALIHAMEVFSTEELIEISRVSGVNHENLPYRQLSAFRRELVLYHGRRQSYPRLLQALHNERPEVGWSQVIGIAPQKAGTGDVVHGTQINMPGDFRGAQINIGTAHYGRK